MSPEWVFVIYASVLLGIVLVDRMTGLNTRLSSARGDDRIPLPGDVSSTVDASRVQELICDLQGRNGAGTEDPVERFAHLVSVAGISASDGAMASLLAEAYARAQRTGAEAERMLLFSFWRSKTGGQTSAGSRLIVSHLAGLFARRGNTDCPAIPVYRESLSFDPDPTVFCAIIEALDAHGRRGEVIEFAAQRRDLVDAAAALLDETTGNRDRALAALERIVKSHCMQGHFDADCVDRLYLRVLRHTTGAFVRKEEVGRLLMEHIEETGRQEEAVRAVEKEIRPLSWNDYSNFHEVFSMSTWVIVRSLLSIPQLKVEMERFVTRNDRVQYWKHFNGGERHGSGRDKAEATTAA